MSFTLIQTQAALDLMAKKLSGEPVIAFDLESASNLHHYVNRICVLQFAARCGVFVVDTLAPLDFSPIGRILEDPAIEIIMHDTDFDLRSLDHDYGWHPRNLFDTLIAARICGHKEFGLAALLEKHFGIRGSKKFQRADWTIRPLPPELLEYAASDVTDLIELRNILAEKIEKLGRTKWARAEFALCEKKRFKTDERPLFARVKKARELCSGQELAILNELAILRNEIAKELDLPLFKVVSDDTLVSLAQRPPQNKEDLAAQRGLHHVCKEKFAPRFIEAVQRGQKAPKLKWPRPKKEGWHGDCPLSVLGALKSWRLAYAASIDVEPDLVLSMNSLKRLAGGHSIDEVLSDEPISVWHGHEIRNELDKLLSFKGITENK